MKPYIASLVNAITLIALGLWAYFTSEKMPITALIPVFVGIALFVLTPGVRKEGKIASHIAVLLTLLILVGLIKPLTGAIERSSDLGIARVVIMMLTTITALIFFIKSFIDARTKRQQAN
ncbi:MAG: hypothetical protein MK078_14845 [Crocinitomicaceae bacterium]|nr:hypothetical protein [Crocinitomicaceae bacterium]